MRKSGGLEGTKKPGRIGSRAFAHWRWRLTHLDKSKSFNPRCALR
jgi:hypothetical protein